MDSAELLTIAIVSSLSQGEMFSLMGMGMAEWLELKLPPDGSAFLNLTKLVT